MTEEERKAHMAQDALVMKRFIRGVIFKIALFLGVVASGVLWFL